MLLITQYIVGYHHSHPDRITDLPADPTIRTRHQIIAVLPPFKPWRRPTEKSEGTANYQEAMTELKARGWTITKERHLASDNYIVWRSLFLSPPVDHPNRFELFQAEKEIN